MASRGLGRAEPWFHQLSEGGFVQKRFPPNINKDSDYKYLMLLLTITSVLNQLLHLHVNLLTFPNKTVQTYLPLTVKQPSAYMYLMLPVSGTSLLKQIRHLNVNLSTWWKNSNMPLNSHTPLQLSKSLLTCGTRGRLIIYISIAPYSIYQFQDSFYLVYYTGEPADGDKPGGVLATYNGLHHQKRQLTLFL